MSVYSMTEFPLLAAPNGLPYLPQPELTIGSLTFHSFGALVGLAVLVGWRHGRTLARKRGLEDGQIFKLAAAALIPGFLGAALLDAVFYHPERLGEEGLLSAFRVSEGLSSVGGFLGATVGLWFTAGRLGLSRFCVGDLCVRALVMSWPVGRLACTLAHDHQGRLTEFPLAFEYPEAPVIISVSMNASSPPCLFFRWSSGWSAGAGTAPE